MVNEYEINGILTLLNNVSGNLSSGSISGNTVIPTTLDRTAIHYDTTEAWNSMTNYVGLPGHIYIYKDYTTRSNEDGTTEKIPAVKIGDGTTYLVDLPFTVVGDAEAFVEHINNLAIHVSPSDRTSWGNKVSTMVTGENLTFSL